MVHGVFQASDSPTFKTGVVTLAKIKSAPPYGVATILNIKNTTDYRYYRYLGPANGYCNIAELEFLG